MTDQAHYPITIQLVATHADSVAPLVMARAYLTALHEAGLSEVVEIQMANSKSRRGTRADLEAALEAVGPDTHFFWFRLADETTVMCQRARGLEHVIDDHRWHVEIGASRPPTESWMVAMRRVARAAIAMPEFEYIVLVRDGGHAMAFVPRPPLARSFHVVTITEQQVAEKYDDPDVFWRVWEVVEPIGNVRLCARHLDALEEEDWLARTFDDTMELARHARPKLTYYDSDPYWFPAYAPWWEHGDHQDEKAGFPALTLVGYIADARTVELTGVVTKRPLQEGGEDPRHVLITEIHDVRALVAREQTADGRPVDSVRVVFPEEWMARQERRPLLDVGARVFYMDCATGALVEITD